MTSHIAILFGRLMRAFALLFDMLTYFGYMPTTINRRVSLKLICPQKTGNPSVKLILYDIKTQGNIVVAFPVK